MKHGDYLCTKNREDDVFRFLNSLVLNESEVELILIDSSEPEIRRENLKSEIKLRFPKLKFTYLYHLGRLPSARNAGIQMGLKHDLIHFFDDDVSIPPKYFKKIESFFQQYPLVFGGGPRIKGSYLPDEMPKLNIGAETVRRFRNVRLKFRKYGAVNSGCKHHWVQDKPQTSQVVQWIPGCAMFFKPEVFEKFTFNAQMENGLKSYAFGEDLEFTYRVGREFKLMSVDTTSIEHHLSPSVRSDFQFIAACLGASCAHMYLMFPREFSIFRIYSAKIAEFTLYVLANPGGRLSNFMNAIKSFHIEFKKEIRENNWKQISK